MKTAVIVFPGSNRDGDVARALTWAGASVTKVWHGEPKLPRGTDLAVLPGSVVRLSVPAATSVGGSNEGQV